MNYKQNHMPISNRFAPPYLREIGRVRWIGFFFILLLFTQVLNAQVTIGSANTPIGGALLMLDDGTTSTTNTSVNATGGLGLPRVNLSKLKPTSGTELAASIGNIGDWNMADHTGLVVYNSNKQETANRICAGLHVWDGTEWQPLTPYPEWENSRDLLADLYVDFTYLDPNDTADPNFGKFAEYGKNPANYPIGQIGLYTDTRDANNEQYHTNRYYVGISNRIKRYKTTANYSCDPNGASSGTEITEEEPYGVFEDGVWMAQSMRAKVMDPVRDDPNDTPVVLENRNGDGTTTLAAWFQSNGVAGDNTGLLYTWAAATNKKITTNDTNEQGNRVIKTTQGICPNGWHLAIDKEWTDLFNGLLRKASLFSSTPDEPASATIKYLNSSLIPNTSLATIVRSTTTGTEPPPPPEHANENNTPKVGTSKPAAQGGFDILFPGNGPGGNGTEVTFWTSSAYLGMKAMQRYMNNVIPGVIRYFESQSRMGNVRCKIND